MQPNQSLSEKLKSIAYFDNDQQRYQLRRGEGVLTCPFVPPLVIPARIQGQMPQLLQLPCNSGCAHFQLLSGVVGNSVRMTCGSTHHIEIPVTDTPEKVTEEVTDKTTGIISLQKPR